MIPAPLPSHDDMAMALTSPDERERVDRMYAAACGLSGGAADMFVDRVALFDVRERARQISDAEMAVDLARLDRDLADFWERNPVISERPALRLVRGTRRTGRKIPPRSDAA